VAPHQVLLQRRHLVRRHPHLGQLAKAGVDPICRSIAGRGTIDYSARSQHAAFRSGSKGNFERRGSDSIKFR
jgi:hypothetical protein